MNTLTDSIIVQKTKRSRISEIDFNNLEFGKHLSDHMLLVEYDKGQLLSPSVVPYADMTITPANLALHYGQSVFDGLNDYRKKDGNIRIILALNHNQRWLE